MGESGGEGEGEGQTEQGLCSPAPVLLEHLLGKAGEAGE